MFFTDTRKADISKIDIEGFWGQSQIRSKHKNVIRQSGGTTILDKDNIRPGIKLVENSEGFLDLN